MQNQKIKYAIQDKKDIVRRIIFFLYRRIQPYIEKKNFAYFGERTILYKPTRLMGAKYIQLGNHVTINQGGYLYALKINTEDPILKVGDGSTIGNYSHIVAVGNVEIEEKVLIADKVYIGDNAHNYEDIYTPIIDQGVRFTGKVRIGTGSWIGDNVAIVSCDIGKHCIIGANSFVNRDIPDYSLACGNPAKIIKRYNLDNGEWERYNE